MDTHAGVEAGQTVRQLLKRPTALVPLAMSVAALAVVLGAVAIYGVPGTPGVPPETDEGTAAHLFQILVAGQLPIIGFFALKWLPQAPREASQVLGLHLAAALMALFPVLYFGL